MKNSWSESTTIKSDGKEVKSFRIITKETEKTQEEIKKAKRTNGLWIIITNTSSKEKDKKGLTGGELIFGIQSLKLMNPQPQQENNIEAV